MIFNEHYGVEGHAFLSPSQYHWINYTDDKLLDKLNSWQASQRGTRLHALAAELIELGIKLPRNGQTLSLYVNDAINYMMTPEQILYYSPCCYGTADAISFKRNMLRIHDLKTGVHPASMSQLEVYMSIFCLEYQMNPREIKSELRIYQNNEVVVEHPDPSDIFDIMGKIKHFTKLVGEAQVEE